LFFKKIILHHSTYNISFPESPKESQFYKQLVNGGFRNASKLTRDEMKSSPQVDADGVEG
jgi:hypothetical protein